MATTPPKKGKKRAPPSTPSGKPPAKTSRASSPTPEPSGEFRGWEPPPRNPSDPPVKPLEERQASARKRKTTPAPADPSPASQMDVSEEPVLEYADAPVPPSHATTLSFAT